jgi:NhaP-type Na+/H+ or K+/H+ antiporter
MALLVFLYSIFAGRLGRTPISGPIVFVVTGFILGPMALGWIEGDVTDKQLRVIADLALALILFIDAANADLTILRRQIKIPARMLLIGLPGLIAHGLSANPLAKWLAAKESGGGI